MGKVWLKVVGVMSCQFVMATQQQAFDKASSEYKSMNTSTLQTKNLSSKVRTNDYHKGDISAVSAKGYYEDEAAMDAAKQTHFANNKEAQAVHQASNMNKHEIDPNNPAYKKAIDHQANAEQILSDEGERYDCQHIYQDGGKKTYTEKCQVSNIVPMQCSRYPVVNVIDVPYTTQVSYSGQLAALTTRTGLILVPEAGHITSAWVQLDNYGDPYIYLCKRIYRGFIAGIGMSATWPDCGHGAWGLAPFTVSNISIPVAAGQHINFQLNGGQAWGIARYRGWQIKMNATRHKKEAKVTWSDNCQHINKEACVKMSETCVEPSQTRNFGGVNVHQDCWKYDYTYKCGYKKHDNCDEIAKRCDFISQQCIEEAHGFCYAYERTYQCNKAEAGTKKLICGNPNSIQFTQTLEQATPDDFMQAVSALAGVSEMAKDIKNAKAEVAMLKGNAMDCGEGAIGVYDCCDGGGNFLHGCSDSEKALQKARQKKLATYVGRFCANKVLGVCLAYHQVWCVFESKLARILQEQGRRNQLGISFGSAEHPNCQGIPVHDLQRIDFTKIDFREFYDEVKSKVTLPDDKTANSLFNKFKAGKTSPEINIKQKNSRISA